MVIYATATTRTLTYLFLFYSLLITGIRLNVLAQSNNHNLLIHEGESTFVSVTNKKNEMQLL